MARMIPETPSAYDRARVIERPDGFYWQEKDTDLTYGPFASLWDAMEDMEGAETGSDAGERLEVEEAHLEAAHFLEDGQGDDGRIDFDRL